MTTCIPSSWPDALLARLRSYFALKFVGTTAFISLFFVAYFHVLHTTAHEAVVMPTTALDRWIGFQPEALVAYVSLWFYVGIPPSLLRHLREMIAYALWAAALCGAGLACFWFWPTAVPPHAVDLARHPAFWLIQGFDAPGNACPSLHVATAAFSAVWLNHLLSQFGAARWTRIVNWCWVALIAWYTLATKQHVALDMLAGLALGVAFALPSLRLRPRGP